MLPGLGKTGFSMCNRSRFRQCGFSGEIVHQSEALGGCDESSLLGMAPVATGGILNRAKSEGSKFVMTTNEVALLTVQEVARSPSSRFTEI